MIETTDFPGDQGTVDAQSTRVAREQTPQGPNPVTRSTPTPALADPLLALTAATLDDLESTRIANENRLRQLTRSVQDSDGETFGLGLPEDAAEVRVLTGIVEAMGAVEQQAILALQRQMRRHPLGPWALAHHGFGLKQGARLLAAIGDPYWNDLHDRPRTVSELWAFCGYRVIEISAADQASVGTQARNVGSGTKQGDPDHTRRGNQPSLVGVAQSRTKGQKSNWSPTAKMRVYLVAVSCMRQRKSPYRAVYDEARVKYADSVHQMACRRCGPSGKPAQPGSALSDGHKLARALRLVSKEILKDLWLEARRIHGVPEE